MQSISIIIKAHKASVPQHDDHDHGHDDDDDQDTTKLQSDK